MTSHDRVSASSVFGEERKNERMPQEEIQHRAHAVGLVPSSVAVSAHGTNDHRPRVTNPLLPPLDRVHHRTPSSTSGGRHAQLGLAARGRDDLGLGNRRLRWRIGGGDERTGIAQSRLFNAGDGHATADVQAHPQIFTLSGGNSCTAWLAASNVAITAGHCTHAGAINPPNDVPYVPFTGNYTVNPSFNASAAVKKQLPAAGAWSLPATNVTAHPLFTHLDASSVDIAVVVLPRAISRCAMKPLEVADQLPDPGIDPDFAGTPGAWYGLLVQQYGAGTTDAGCTAGFGTSVMRLNNIVGGYTASTLYPHQGLFFFPSSVDGSHICGGDSGGPVLTLPEPIFAPNIPLDTVLTLNSSRSIEQLAQYGTSFGPELQSGSDVYTWLMGDGSGGFQGALDRDNDQIPAADDNCDAVANLDQADADGDGIGDACDAVPGENDCGDSDGDGIPNHMDACVGPKGNGDADGDGIIDCLDPCPDDPTNVDPDGDHVCGADDNCPSLVNPDQANCNSHAEQAMGLLPIGDVCDPIPCPRATQTSTTSAGGFYKVTRSSTSSSSVAAWRFPGCARRPGRP